MVDLNDRAEQLPGSLRRAAEDGSFVPFERFMEIALYAPEEGFYTRRSAAIGSAADFYTAPHVSPLFGQAVANRVVREFESLGRPYRFTIIEMGPGEGALAEPLVRSLGPRLPADTEVRYLISERSGPLRQRALERIGRAAPASWEVTAVDSAGAMGPFVGVVVANEYLDALPGQRFVLRDHAWHELGVRWTDGRFRWAGSEAPAPRRSLPWPAGAEEGTILELSRYQEAFLRELADHLLAGVALFLDYGMEEEELVRGHPRGTLAAYRDHHLSDDPLQGPGTADLSMYVNFTRLRHAARAAGLTEVGPPRSQSQALGEWGIAELIRGELDRAPSEEARVKAHLAAKNLLFGFDRFRVWELSPPERTATVAT
ncbi:MAG: SAM-dependent methyltransferase [Thermoplasmata archaeon]